MVSLLLELGRDLSNPLSRYIANKRDGTRRRTPLIQKCRNGFVYKTDAATGNTLLRALGIQGVVMSLGGVATSTLYYVHGESRSLRRRKL
jgi:hypothetical protein